MNVIEPAMTPMPIPLVNLQRNYERYQRDYEQILTRTAAGCDFILGKAVTEFEQAFASYLGVKHVIGVASGTDALTLALKALGLPAKSKIATQANTFVATTLAIRNAGHQIVLTDCDLATGAMIPKRRKVAAALPVHLYGRPIAPAAVQKAYGKNCVLLEDAAQAHGSRIGGAMCGSLGKAAAFSFYPGKNLGAFGDGGAVATNDDQLADEVRSLRNWGSPVKYVHDREGSNSRLDTLQAAILSFKLQHLDEWNQQRDQLVHRYRQALVHPSIELPPRVPVGTISCHHLFVIRLLDRNRDEILQGLQEANIGAGIHYPVPIHQQALYCDLDIASQSFPNAELRAQQILSLPLFPELTYDEVDRVCQTLLELVDAATPAVDTPESVA